jgi:hypothetical protein
MSFSARSAVHALTCVCRLVTPLLQFAFVGPALARQLKEKGMLRRLLSKFLRGSVERTKLALIRNLVRERARTDPTFADLSGTEIAAMPDYPLYGLPEGTVDGFWVTRAKHYDPEFKVAPVEVALRFAFECASRFCSDATDRNLPFGCSAWERYDPEFWRPFLLE